MNNKNIDNSWWNADDIPLDKPSIARIYDYLLGGYHNFEIDREMAQKFAAVYPDVGAAARANRNFLRRAAEFMLAEGVTQFIDIGSGIPTAGHLHEIVQKASLTYRVVYVDIDPVAVAHSEAILQDNAYAVAFRADGAQAENVMQRIVDERLLDFTQPVGLLFIAMLHFVADDLEAERLVERYCDYLAPGSFIAFSHLTKEGVPSDVIEAVEKLSRAAQAARYRSRSEIETMFGCLSMVPPGVVYTPLWRPEGPDDVLLDEPARIQAFAGVGRWGGAGRQRGLSTEG